MSRASNFLLRIAPNCANVAQTRVDGPEGDPVNQISRKMPSVTRTEIREAARSNDIATLIEQRDALEDAVGYFAHSGDPALALELFGRAWRVWLTSGALTEGRETAITALDAQGVKDVAVWRTRTLFGDGVLAFRSGDTEGSRSRNEEALRIAQAEDDVIGECEALTGLARVALREERYDEVVALAGRGRERAQEVGGRAAEASPLHLLAAGARLQGKYPEARALYLQSLELGNEAWQAMEHDCLGWVALHLGEVDEAEARFRKRDLLLGPDPYAKAWSDLTWSALAVARGDRDLARRRYDKATKSLFELSNEFDPDDQSEFDWLTRKLAELEV